MNRVLPLGLATVLEGFVVLDPGVHEVLLEEVAKVLASQLRIEREVLELADLLAEASVEVRVLKGVATAHLDYDEPSHRQFGDGDLLVRPDDLDRVRAVLDEQGISTRPIRGGDPRVQHAFTPVIGGLELDVHHRLLPQGLGHLLGAEDLFADPNSFTVGGRELLALPPHLRLLQAAVQNVATDQQETKWSSDFDVLRLSAHLEAALDVADRSGLGWVVRTGCRRAGLDVGHDSTTDWRATVTKWTYSSGRAHPVKGFASELILAPRSAPVLLKSVAVPGEQYLATRDRSRSAHLVRQFRRFVDRRR